MSDYSVLEARVNSFKQTINGVVWPYSEDKLTAESMAAAGLYFTPHKQHADMVTCFSCKGRLCGFVPTDDPMLDHRTNFPTCKLSLEEITNEAPSVSVESLSLKSSDLPTGWSISKTSSGQIYYVNHTTGETSFEIPSASDAPAAVQSFGTSKALSKKKVTLCL